jgi:hypothetical protein
VTSTWQGALKQKGVKFNIQPYTHTILQRSATMKKERTCMAKPSEIVYRIFHSQKHTDIRKEPDAFVQDKPSCFMQSIFGTKNGDSPLSSYFSPTALQQENKNKLITAVPTRCKVSLSPHHTIRSQPATLTS